MWKFVTAWDNDGHPLLRSLNGNAGRQVWVHDPEGGTPAQRAAVEEARRKFEANRLRQRHSADELLRLQCAGRRRVGPFPADDGHWPGDYGGPMFLMPGLIIALYTMEALEAVLSPAHRAETVRYLRNHQNPDGGYGLHIEGESTMFGTALSYVTLRLLGVGPDDTVAVAARAWIHSHGGATMVTSWGKFWLALLGVYSWEGLNPMPPEMWLLPYAGHRRHGTGRRVIEEAEEPLAEYYRHRSKGAWPFSTRDHGWPISDCTSEGLKASLALARLPAGLVGPAVPPGRLRECVDMVNPSETFGDIIIDYDHVECSSACITALVAFRAADPSYRAAEVARATARGLRYVKSVQRPDGSWYGNWGVCFTYAGWFGAEALAAAGESAGGGSAPAAAAAAFLLSKQRPDGGWGESYLSCQDKARGAGWGGGRERGGAATLTPRAGRSGTTQGGINLLSMASVAAFAPASAAARAPRLAPRGAGARGRRPAPAPARRSPRPVAAAAAAAAATERVPQWDVIYARLVKEGLQSVAPEAAAVIAGDGRAVLVDVRPKEKFEEAHPTGAVSVPFFRFLDLGGGLSVGRVLKWAAMSSQGVKPTEPNPAFLKEVAAAAANGKSVILYCEASSSLCGRRDTAGGTLEPTVSFPQGKTSRSLIAAWKARTPTRTRPNAPPPPPALCARARARSFPAPQIIASGTLPVDRVLHLDGGVYRWAKAGLPVQGVYDPSAAGSTPNAAEKPTGKFFD
eukprot:scaffold28.g7563.t1